jgi:mRNA interferase RelE/StbE
MVVYSVVVEPRALRIAAEQLGRDPKGLAVLFDAIDALASEPRPAEAAPWGGEGILRLRVGDWRVLYEVDDAELTVVVVHIGRTEAA